MDRPPNNNQGNNNWFGTVANLAVNGGIAYGAYRGVLAVSSSLTAAPPHVKVGSFIVVYAGIYVTRRFVDEDRINNLVNNANNWGNNRGGNWFNSPLESGEALQNDSLSLYLGDIISLNLIILMLFNILIIVLINKVVGHKIIEWLQTKMNTNNIIYRIINGSYRANMSASTWLIWFIIIFIYIFMLAEIWGLRTLQDILMKFKL